MTFATGFAGYPSTNLFLALTFKGRRGRGILYCACICLNFLKLTGWRLYRFRLARLYGTCNFRSSLSPSSWLQVLPAGPTGTLGIPLSLKPCFWRKQVMLCFKSLQREIFQWTLYLDRKISSTRNESVRSSLCSLPLAKASTITRTLHLRRLPFPRGSCRLSQSGGLSFQASPPTSSAPPDPPHPHFAPPLSPRSCHCAQIPSPRLENFPVTQPMLRGRTPHSLFRALKGLRPISASQQVKPRRKGGREGPRAQVGPAWRRGAAGGVR